jgi:hypothetical protein
MKSRRFFANAVRRVDNTPNVLHKARRFWRLGSSMVEQLTLNQLVLGSSPSRGTISFFTTFFKNSRAQKVSKTAKNRYP